MAGLTGDSGPYYQQVANVLRARIINSDPDRPVRLATERDLCQAHRVSRETIRKALDVLAQEGLLERTRHRGTLTVPAGIRAWRRLRRSRVISIVTVAGGSVDVPDTFYGRILQASIARAEDAGYSISLTSVGSSFPSIRSSDPPENADSVLGVIIVGIQDERLVQMHARAGYPVVAVDYYARSPMVDCVVVDCFNEGEQAGEFLLAQGHRELFYLGNCHGPRARREHEADADLMLAGLQRALRRAGVVLPPERVLFCWSQANDIQPIVEQVLRPRPQPSAGLIFDPGTFETYRAQLPRFGLACPEDLSLMCKSVPGHSLEATALYADPEQMGRTAVDLLLERASGRRSATICAAIRSRLHRGPTVRQIGTDCIPGI